MSREPLAIVGVGCRLPGGVESLDDLCALLRAGGSGLREVPAGRWDAASLHHPDYRKRGHLHVHRGGFLDEVAEWDAGFFGVSPREALSMDPQQRLVLEVTYRAIEDAGLRLDELAGSRTSVFVGCGSRDYAIVQAERRLIGPTTNTGSAASIVANRVSFTFDLRGPSVAVDTACSSSLAAFHLACQTLWDGTAELALAGGVNLILSPEASMGFSKGGYLSPSGECRAFSADGDGYVRSEGAGMILIAPAARARALGLRVHGLIRATVLNQDGRTPGMTMPSQAAQEEMLRQAYAQAGVDPHRVAYVEAHGTGTPVGDPLEAGAIGQVLGAGRDPAAPLWLGSVKSNLGHLEPAAGVAGLLKLILTLRERTVFPQRNFTAPHPGIPFQALRLRVATALTPLAGDGPLVGGVNSFGFGGTNGHLVLEGPPARAAGGAALAAGDAAGDAGGAVGAAARAAGDAARAAGDAARAAGDAARPEGARAEDPAGPLLLLASARSEAALRAHARDLAGYLERTPHALPDVIAALARQRTAFPHRLAQVGADRAALVAGLRACAEGAEGGARTARLPDALPPQPVVFVFSGQGPQWWAMGRELLEREPLFRGPVLEVERALAALGWLQEEGSSLTRELLRDEASSRMGQTRVAQPALFALQLGLAALLRAHGVEPAAAVGHSIGELAAAVTAGALELSEATRIVFWRSRCQARAEGAGAMAAIGLSAGEVAPLLAGLPGRVELAAENGPRAVTVAGEAAGVAALGQALEARGVFFRRLEVSVPFHCFLMDPLEEELRRGLARVAARAGGLPFFSTVDPGPVPGQALDADYWWRNVRAPVRFAPAVEALLQAGFTRFVELAPQPILRRGILDALAAANLSGAVVPTLVRGQPERPALLACLGELFLQGVPCDPLPRASGASAEPGHSERGLRPGHTSDTPRDAVRDLPVYPFQRRRYWLESAAARDRRRLGRAHPTVGRPRPSSESRRRFTAALSIDPEVETWLLDHHVQGLIVLPGAGQLEAAYSAARLAWPDEDPWLESFLFRLPLSLPPEGDPPEFQLEVFSDEGQFEIASRSAAAEPPPPSSAAEPPSPGSAAEPPPPRSAPEPPPPRSAAPGAWTVHTRGRLNPLDPFPSVPVDLQAIRARVTTPVADPALFYEELATTGLVLGPAFQGVRALWAEASSGEILARVEPPAALGGAALGGPALEHELRRYFVHPALLDSVLQASSLGSVTLGKRGLFLPHRVRRLKFHRRPGVGPLWVYSRLVRAERADVEVDLWALDEDGRAVIEIQGFSMRLVPGSELSERGRPAAAAAAGARAAGEAGTVYALGWDEVPAGEPGPPPPAGGPAWLLVGAPAHTGPLAQVLGGCARAVGPDQAPDAWLERAALPLGVGALVHLGTLDPAAHDPQAAVERGPAALTAWVAALGRRGLWAPRATSGAGTRPQVFGVTAGAWRPAGEQDGDPVRGGDQGRVAPWGAPLWGLLRVLRHEDPRLEVSAIDLDPAPVSPGDAVGGAIGAARWEALAALLREAPPPAEVCLRAGRRFAPRLAPADPRAPKRIDAARRAFRARVETPGVLDSLGLVEARRPAPAPHQVEVEVRAAALNFKDVVVAMGLLDAQAWAGGMTGAELGMDCAGVVTRVGSQVTALRPGDEVLGMAHNSLASHVLADPRHMVRKRAELSFAEAASLSTVFLTAAVALKGLARLRAGETVLIHSAAGGVGTAAVQLAHELGARVIATTSSQRKREYLRGLGVETIFDSRSAEFRRHVLAATGGRGVDVVLSALAGDAMTQGIRCLAPFGRFVEIGKLDLERNRQLGLEPFLHNLSYHCLDLNRWVAAYLDEATPELEAIVEKTARGVYRAPVTVFPIERAGEALRGLAKGQHVGKVVVELPRAGPLQVAPGERELFRADGAYLVTGGCQGLGLEVAEWIAARGGGALLLLSRTGSVDPARRAALEARGARVLALACDVGDRAALVAALDRARRELPPLRGVFHLAMVLDDAPLGELTPQRFQAVARPKLAGAWHLHELCAGDPLDHFALFSSIAALLGTPGQGNYAAANAFLEALAAERQAAGLPGACLALGPIVGAGVLERLPEERRRRVLGAGVAGLGVARALEGLERVLVEERAYRLLAAVEWSALPLPLREEGGRATPFSALASGATPAASDRSLLEQLRAAPAGERVERLVGHFAAFLAQLSGEAPEAIDGGSSLSRLGIDSLLANQLLVWVEAQFGVAIPLVRLMQGPTVRQLAQDVVTQAFGGQGPAQGRSSAAPT